VAQGRESVSNGRGERLPGTAVSGH
jgi:hypothetical protein